ncbi:fatty acyl-CoA hydrolase precursor, medium chain-like [Gastrophryne carolinensis]
MVFIHGGALIMGGAGMYEGSAFSAYENMVVVSIQYRLSILGFFSTGDERLPGNYGFLDQVAALRWVQENIKAFGGDPNSVTIAGVSAGGVSVAALVLSPLAKGLFHRAAAESGVALFPGLMAHTAEEVAPFQQILVNASGCDVSTLVECLKEKSEEEMMALITALVWSNPTSPLKFLAPPGVTDGFFLPKPAEQIMADKEMNPVPFLTGVVEQEYGWGLTLMMNISGLSEGIDRKTANATLHSDPWLGTLGPLIPLLLEEYIGDETDPAEIRNRFLDLCGDAVFVMPALKTVKYHRDAGHPVFFYEFRHRPNVFKNVKPEYVKADHGDDIAFVIGGPFLPEGQLFSGACAAEEEALSRTIMKYWANFARTGNPNGPGLVHWPQYDEDEGYLQIDIQQTAAQRLKEDKYKFWYKILPERMQRMAGEESQDYSEL